MLLIDKPEGFTSFDVVAKLRGITKTKKIGHTGTLDPMATGVLPVLLGRSAKAADLLLNHDKAYIACLKLGTTTDTQDITGRILSENSHNITKADVLKALPLFTGKILQLPPMYSAVRVNGQRLYDVARSGREVERSPRAVTVNELRLLDSDEAAGTYSIYVKCSRGTYIRALCHDLGEKLGSGAVMTSLRRTMACGYGIEDCITLDYARELCGENRLNERLIPIESAFLSLSELVLNDRQSAHFLNGLNLGLYQFGDIPNGKKLRVLDENRRFLGLASPDSNSNTLKIIKLFITGDNK